MTAPARATTLQLVFMTYAVVCSGAYGLEQIVSTSGPGLAIVVLLVLPVVYAAPMALTCAELTARFPVEGGYYRWVRMAFGDLVGYTAGWLAWLTTFATSASFAVLFGHYLGSLTPGFEAGAQFAAAAGLVWAVVLLNCRGITVVGTMAVVVTILIAIPFAVMTVLGALQWRFSPVHPFVHPDKTVTTALAGGVLIAMWLYGGFEKMTMNAEEIEDPVRAFPIALGIAVPLCALSYVLPTLAALAATGDWQAWGEAHYTNAAARIGGPWLGTAMAAGGVVSNAALLMVTLLAQSRLPMVLAADGLFPRCFERRHRRFGTPVVSLVAAGVVLTGLCSFRFTQLVGVYALAQSLTQLLIFAALFRLRERESDPGVFRIPLGTAGLCVMAAPSVLLGLLVVREGLFPGGSLDGRQALLLAASLGSGAIVYAFMRPRIPMPAAAGTTNT